MSDTPAPKFMNITEQETELFEAALRLPQDRWADYLVRHCADPDRRTRLQRLLAAVAGSHDFMAHCAALPETGRPEMPGDKLGGYQLTQTLGEGSYGRVFRAFKEQPVRLEVALKVLKAGLDTYEILGRFNAERHALARLQHPGIARIYDSGATATGRPFFAMELVSGQPITQFCNERRLSIDRRLELFEQVCHAVEYAHQRGVIHRDLKPSNVLVTEIAGKATAKVIDFGIAKAVQDPFTDQTSLSRNTLFIGTPKYMSPEQARGSDQVDIRTDVYSLGVLLYELLAGEAPLSAELIAKAGIPGLAKLKEEFQPPMLSEMVRTLANQPNRKPRESCGLDTRELLVTVKGDLEWIAAKALERDIDHRYASVGELTADLRRHQNHEVVTAREPSTGYRISRFIRRHQGSVTAAALVLLALLIELATSLWQWRRAVAAQHQATQSLAESQTSVAILSDIISSAGPSKTPKDDARLLITLLSNAQHRVTSATNLSPKVSTELIAVISSTLFDLGAYTNAQAQMDQLIARCERDFGSNSVPTARAYGRRAALAIRDRELDKAQFLATRALAVFQSTPGLEREVLQTRVNLATIAMRQGRNDDALKAYRELSATLETAHPELIDERIAANGNLAILYSNTAYHQQASDHARKALELSASQTVPNDPRTAMTQANLAGIQMEAGQWAMARSNLTAGLAVLRTKLNPKHPVLSLLEHNEGLLSARENRLPQAHTELQKSLDSWEIQFKDNPEHLSQALTDLAEVEYWSNDLTAARDHATRALEIVPKGKTGDNQRAITHQILAAIALAQNNPDVPRTNAAAALRLFAEQSMNTNWWRVVNASITGELAATTQESLTPQVLERMETLWPRLATDAGTPTPARSKIVARIIQWIDARSNNSPISSSIRQSWQSRAP